MNDSVFRLCRLAVVLSFMGSLAGLFILQFNRDSMIIVWCLAAFGGISLIGVIGMIIAMIIHVKETT
jgi:hypothetical protein